MTGNNHHLIELANYKMPFGRFKGKYLVHIPEAYYIWYKGKGFPQGKLGRMMQEMHEIKVNGLEYLLTPLIKKIKSCHWLNDSFKKVERGRV